MTQVADKVLAWLHNVLQVWPYAHSSILKRGGSWNEAAAVLLLYCGSSRIGSHASTDGHITVTCTSEGVMTQVADKVLAWLHNVLQEYPNLQRTYFDAARTLAAFTSLAPRTEVYTHENGSSELLLTLSGTLPIDFKGTIYHFPVKTWVPRTYPQDAPIVFVDPARDMLIRPGQHVGVDGRVYHAYLRDWKKMQDRASITECLDYVQQVFAKEPPVISRMHQRQHQQRSGAYQDHAKGHDTRPPQLPPKPSTGSTDPVELPTIDRPTPPPKPPKLPDQQHQQHTPTFENSSQIGPAVARFPHETPRYQQYGVSPYQIQGTNSAPRDWRSSSTDVNYRHEQFASGPDSGERAPAVHFSNGHFGPARSANGHPIPPHSARSGTAQDVPPMMPRINPGTLPQYRRTQSPVSPVSPVARLSEQSHRQYSEMSASRYRSHAGQYQPRQDRHSMTADPVPQSHFAGQVRAQAQHIGLNQRGQVSFHTAGIESQAPPDLLSGSSDMASLDHTGSAPSSAPPVPPNPEKEHLLHALSVSLISQTQEKVNQNLSHLTPLRAQEQALNAAHARIDSEIRQLEHLSELLNVNESILHRAVQDCEATIKSAQSKPPPPIDEVLVAPTLVAQQLWTLSAEEAACREAMYVLQKALDQGRITGEVFMRQMRSLGRECFLKMALVRNSRAAPLLPHSSVSAHLFIMGDEEKEKAEKLAAAKKRFEQLKKEQAKKGKKSGGTKKKDEKKTEEAEAEAEAAVDPSTVVEEEEKAGEGDEEVADDTARQSKQRSESFRQSSTSAGSELSELYKKQAARIEDLEKENKSLVQQHEERTTRLGVVEGELDALRENSGELAELRSKAKDADRVGEELVSVQRQLAQAQQAIKAGGTNRRASGATSGANEELESKTSLIEELELELSNVRNQLSALQAGVAERDASIRELEQRAKAVEIETASYKQELEALKVSIAFPSDETKAANEDPEALTKRITVLESDLRTANSSLAGAGNRASSLEQKIEALTNLHRDATRVSQNKDKEVTELRDQLKKRNRPSHVEDASEFELGDEETETGALQARIRSLEAENFDLRRGVWRDKRAELQPGMDDSGATNAEYEDVDLNAVPLRGSAPPRQSSTFQDVLTSGINAFTGRSVHQEQAHGHARNQSLGLLEDDDGEFDEEAFRLAQEEDAKRRIERVKDVKRGLEKWKGWRVDVVVVQQQQQQQRQTPGIGAGERGPVFEL
nr:tumor susceptibility gene 101 protein [Quercus suber]